jgi:GH15 family glucan-1,4-alpha-glucosidase
MNGGFYEAARDWREWLLRAVAGSPKQLQIMYGIEGERRLTELELPWLPGYEGAAPVRIGNAASGQLQLDVYGEVMDALYQGRRGGLGALDAAFDLQRAMLDHLGEIWRQPDDGIWEVRGGRQHFTYSKVMAWVAFDRAAKAVELFHLEGPKARWEGIRDQIHAEVCRRGYDSERRTFVQEYGGKALDASLLMLPLVGFLPAGDERVLGTVRAVERYLTRDGLVMRYEPDQEVDGLASREGVFLPCSFWLVDNLALGGRADDAGRLFEGLLDLCNDVGLISEEYDPDNRRLLGNFPQAFTHVALINSARNLTRSGGPSEHRSGDDGLSGSPT